jgi:hypothetical protein
MQETNFVRTDVWENSSKRLLGRLGCSRKENNETDITETGWNRWDSSGSRLEPVMGSSEHVVEPEGTIS